MCLVLFVTSGTSFICHLQARVVSLLTPPLFYCCTQASNACAHWSTLHTPLGTLKKMNSVRATNEEWTHSNVYIVYNSLHCAHNQIHTSNCICSYFHYQYIPLKPLWFFTRICICDGHHCMHITALLVVFWEPHLRSVDWVVGLWDLTCWHWIDKNIMNVQIQRHSTCKYSCV